MDDKPWDANYLLQERTRKHLGNHELRSAGPVARVTLPSGGVAWLVTGHETARQVLSDRRLRGRTGLVGDPRRLPRALYRAMNTHMLNMNPPDHTRLRNLVSAAFTMRRTHRLRPRIQSIADSLIDDMAAQDEVDLVTSLALPLPIRVLAVLLGMPESDASRIHTWTETLTDSGVPPEKMESVIGEVLTYVHELLANKRKDPGEDLLSALCAVHDGEDRLTDDELTSMVFLFLIAGQETTVHLIGNAVLTLLEQPERWEYWCEHPDQVRNLVEEVLRHESPVQAAVRYTSEEVEVGGHTIEPRSTVVVSLLAANRDEAVFAEPDTFDASRPPNPHVAFGYGIHHCLGAPLARLEAEVVLSTLLRRLPHLSLAHPVQTDDWRVSLVMHGLLTLPVRLHQPTQL